MLQCASAVLAMAWPRVRPSVCLSVTSRCSIKATAQSNLYFDKEATPAYPTLCCTEIWVTAKKSTPLWNFDPNSGIRQFRITGAGRRSPVYHTVQHDGREAAHRADLSE